MTGSDLVELRGLEPRTSCMPYRLRQSPGGARHGLTCGSPTAMVAGRGLTRPDIARRWLPANSLATLRFGVSVAPTDSKRKFLAWVDGAGARGRLGPCERMSRPEIRVRYGVWAWTEDWRQFLISCRSAASPDALDGIPGHLAGGGAGDDRADEGL
jgi:hypothetical protein